MNDGDEHEDLEDVEVELEVATGTSYVMVTVTPPRKKTRRLCIFNPLWLKKFAPWLVKVDDSTGNCIHCRQTFSVKYEGRKAIAVHAESAKHRSSVLTHSQSRKFFPVKHSAEQLSVTAMELVFTYCDKVLY